MKIGIPYDKVDLVKIEAKKLFWKKFDYLEIFFFSV